MVDPAGLKVKCLGIKDPKVPSGAKSGPIASHMALLICLFIRLSKLGNLLIHLYLS